MKGDLTVASAGMAQAQNARFVARQPIFDREQKVLGYELLFRDGFVDQFRAADPDAASRTTLDSSMLIGLDTLCRGRLAFLNCTRQVLLEDFVTLLPPNLIVIEVLESVLPDHDVQAALARFKQAGYKIALDDFIPEDPREPLTPFADIIKVDLRLTDDLQRKQLVKCYAERGIRMLAEKVETQDEFLQTRAMGFDYFQGYFFRRPVIVQAREIPTLRVHYLQILHETTRPELDLRKLESLIKSEANLCYRLLRYLNSSAFFFSGEIRSVRHALAVLGENAIRRWAALVAAVGAGQEKSELVVTALTRARFCELLSPRLRFVASDLFLLGLLSLMDSLLEMPMKDVLDRVPVEREVKAVLLGEPSRLTPVHQLFAAQEEGNWQLTEELAGKLGLTSDIVFAAFWTALQWAQDVTRGS
jgi:c-di-GMP-related signal transduction protein